jgi:hypothetical protein
MTERRHQPMRREINEIFRDPSGRVSEAKLFSVIGKLALLWVWVRAYETVIADATILSIFVLSWIAPDLLKKLISSRAGVSAAPDVPK